MKVISGDEKATLVPPAPPPQPRSPSAAGPGLAGRTSEPGTPFLSISPSPHTYHTFTHTHTYTGPVGGVSQQQPLAGVGEGSDGGGAAGPSGVLRYHNLLMEFLPRPALRLIQPSQP